MRETILSGSVFAHATASGTIFFPRLVILHSVHTAAAHLRSSDRPLANDYPYRGNILEFRLVDGNESETGGIVGEVWRFPEGGDVLDIPHPPRYVRALKISFDDPRKPGTDVSSPTPHVVSYSCSSGDVDPEGTQVLDAHPSAIEVMPQTTQGHFLQFYRRTHGHPDFPAPDASWYDTERGLPRLQESNLAVDDQRELVSLFPAVRLPVIYTSSTGHTKPAAITISCSRNNSCTCMKHHLQTIIFDTLDIGPPRYYPLRGDIKAGMDPHSEHWTLSSLTGLWLGSFGQHKTECLYLDCDERRQS
ncbi:hypothetical protein A0H81_09217 [Grifola frondosa]|uniref:Uncharacterized protein n=1 Tax=Grifola frondosa TaxID=5627 RepID=A0A1C7M225_GRIFR|nr:hypothetical protein A0H81_09217 [Grifola frondosa]